VGEMLLTLLDATQYKECARVGSLLHRWREREMDRERGEVLCTEFCTCAPYETQIALICSYTLWRSIEVYFQRHNSLLSSSLQWDACIRQMKHLGMKRQ